MIRLISLSLSTLTAIAAIVFMVPATSQAAEEVNVYSARHYDSDDALYESFTEQTGIKVNLTEGKSNELLERISREGKRSPADIFITVDAGRLSKATDRNIFQPIESEILDQRVPEKLRHPDKLWFALTRRVRVILVSKDRVKEGEISSYEELSDPKWRERVLIRSSSNIYNQSLVSSLIETHGDEQTEQWCKGVVKNMARPPQGGDRDQIRAVAAGVGDAAVANHYYYAQLLNSDDQADRQAAAAVRLVFPNQDDRGAHVNISGAGVVATAPNKQNAKKFLEFLVSDDAQETFAAGNNEYPVVKGVKLSPVLEEFGEFTSDDVSVHKFGDNNKKAIHMMDRVRWR
ncbi:MAG: Fe(3+) ABC transporter substrate-binding protein [Planctomycetales bacterium]